MQIDCDGLTSEGISYLCQRCPLLTRLNLQGVCFISDAAVEHGINAGHISSLNLAETNITDVSLRRLAEEGSDQVHTGRIFIMCWKYYLIFPCINLYLLMAKLNSKRSR